LVHGDKVEPALLEAGQHYVAVGWDEMAVETFRRGLALDRSNQRYYAILVELYLRSGQVELARRVVAEARANGMARLFSVALSFEEAGYHQQALVLYQQLIEQGVEGQVKPAFWRLGLDLVDRGRAEQLAPLAQRFLAALGDSFEGHWLVALLYSRAGLSDLALQHLLAAAEKGEAEKGWLLVADAALKAGRRATALEALLRHARGAVGRAAEAGEAIELVLQWGEDELAFALLERLRSGTLGPVHHLLALGRLHLRRGDLWGGASLLQQAVAASREGEETKTRRDVVEELLDHDLLAEAEALLLAGGRPPDKEGQLQLPRLRAEQGDAARLEQALEAYLATQPVDETQDRISAGAILRGRGSFARAVELLRRAMEIAPSGEERRLALYHLLASLHAQGLEQELAAEARRYVERSPAPVAATHEVANELAKLARWELALELIRQRRALARSDYHLLQDELEARLALGQEGEIDELVEDMVQHTFSSGADSRSRNEILGRVASKLAWTMRTGEAIRRFGQLLESAPAEFAPLEKMLAVAIDAGNDGVLAELTSRFFATAGPRPATWRWLARRLVEAGRGGLALPLARQLVSAAPSDLRGHLLLVAALLQAGETSAAQQATAAALQKADDPLRARVAVAALWLQGGHPLPDVDEEGEWLTGDVPAAWLQRAIALAEPVCAPGPAGHATGLLVRGLARLRLGETKRAAEDLDEYLRRGGGFSAGLLEPFPYEEREDIQPGKLVEMGQERLGDVAGSEARLLLLIDSWLAAGEDERAGALAERLAALSANPEQVLGRVLQRASLHGRVALGLKILDWLGQRFPGNVWEVTMLADLLEQSRDSAAAIAAYRKGIEREPHQPVYYNNLAYFFARAGKNLDEALQLVHKARLLGPQGEKYYLDTEGWVLYGLGRKEEALQRIRASTWLMDKGMDSSVAESLYHLGLVLRDLGRQEEATAVLRRAAAMDFRGKYGQMARQELEKGAAMVPVPGEAP
ncbi:MAG: hypothetical protein FJ125_04500, partial [Deltaproteobacteria bacterium]|nr:hypothetical protein [Deltaproteobacteria bacterium]